MWSGKCFLCEKNIRNRSYGVRIKLRYEPTCFTCKNKYGREITKIYFGTFKVKKWESKIKWEKKEESKLAKRLKEYKGTQSGGGLWSFNSLFSSKHWWYVPEKRPKQLPEYLDYKGFNNKERNNPTKFYGLWRNC